MNSTMHYTGTLVLETCCNCGIVFAMPDDFQRRAKANHSISFYCPLGHGQHFIGETDEQKLERQLRATRAQLTSSNDQLESERRSKIALKGHLTRARNKIAAGECPVPDCGQHFSNVREHMKFKHPDYHLIDPETGRQEL